MKNNFFILEHLGAFLCGWIFVMLHHVQRSISADDVPADFNLLSCLASKVLGVDRSGGLVVHSQLLQDGIELQADD